MQIVEDGQIELEEEHFTSSSSDSDAESVEYNAPCQDVLIAPICTFRFPLHAEQEDQDSSPC